MLIVFAHSNEHLRELIAQEMDKQGPQANLNHIDIRRVKNLDGIFKDSAFNGDISRWNMARATSTVDMFYGSAFNGDISGWDVKLLRNANHMFHESKFKGDVSGWNPINLESADFMFAKTPFAGDVSKWHTPFLDSCMHMFDTAAFHGDLSHWVLRSGCLYGQMVHSGFKGQVPSIATPRIVGAYEMLLGNTDILNAYARRTPFGALHAELLLANDDCTWASRKVVRWARGVGEMGRAMGMEHKDIVQWMVQQYPTRGTEPKAIAPAHSFDAPL